MTSDELIEAIEDAGYDCRSYSGRAMYGKECVGVDLDSDGDLWKLAWSLGEAGVGASAPRTDSMGRGIIAYWPSVVWPEGREDTAA